MKFTECRPSDEGIMFYFVTDDGNPVTFWSASPRGDYARLAADAINRAVELPQMPPPRGIIYFHPDDKDRIDAALRAINPPWWKFWK